MVLDSRSNQCAKPRYIANKSFFCCAICLRRGHANANIYTADYIYANPHQYAACASHIYAYKHTHNCANGHANQHQYAARASYCDSNTNKHTNTYQHSHIYKYASGIQHIYAHTHTNRNCCPNHTNGHAQLYAGHHAVAWWNKAIFADHFWAR